MVNVNCPNCGKTSKSDSKVLGARVKCGRCQFKFVAKANAVEGQRLDSLEAELTKAAQELQSNNNLPDDPGLHTLPHPPNQTTLGNEPDPLLDQIIGVLKRMIIGVFRFSFGRLPNLIWQWIKQINPTLQKVAFIFGLFVLWMALIIWPLILMESLSDESLNHLPSFLQHYRDNPLSLASLLVWGWIGITLLGSIWGVHFVRLKRKLQLQTPK
jgi:hypothetical protein